MTLLEMINQAASELGFDEKTEYFGSTKAENRQLRNLAAREINYLKKHEWEVLKSTFQITMTASESYSLPSDFRQFVPDTAFTPSRSVDFPTSSEVWSYLKSNNTSGGIRHRMRRYQGMLQIESPQAGEVVRIEYISKHAVKNSEGVPKEKFTADNDTIVLNDDVFILGVQWRFARAKGLADWVDLREEYRSLKRAEMATDAGSQTISSVDSDGDGLTEPFADLLV